MRRGQSGISGWRSDNPRHFRPRGPHSRPPHSFGHYDSPRYRSAILRPLLPSPYAPSRPLEDQLPPNQNNRTQYIGDHSRPRDGPRHHQRQILPYLQRMRRNELPEKTPFNEPTDYYDQMGNQSGQFHINSMGDIDDRANIPHHTDFVKRHALPWSHSNDKRHHYNDGHHSKHHSGSRHHDSIDTNPIPEYSGHRPPASDHYGSSVGLASDNSKSFSRSVDDTVDIVRKKLLNRSDPQCVNQEDNVHPSEETCAEEPTTSYPEIQAEQQTKRRTQHQRQNIQSNCDKIKNKIVHQLFKMDKDRIHKLMDNPNSSHKFEYAISSLITESQNSLNRHLRSVAEKSLSNATDIINDDNTIYEDTFMKQMQCILEPQDTVFLEDIKPLVMAELNKVLQLNDFDQIYDHPSHMEEPPYDQIDDRLYTDQYYEEYQHNEPSQSYEEKYAIPSNYESLETRESMSQSSHEETPLFERRPNKPDYSEARRVSSEKRRHSKFSMENNSLNDDTFQRSESAAVPLFDPNSEQHSEDDDPFAELDKQYHVAVDHNFIETDDLLISQVTDVIRSPVSPTVKKECIQTPVLDVKREIDNQLHEIAKSPVKLSSTKRTDVKHSKYRTDRKSMDVTSKSISYASSEKSNKGREFLSEPEKSEDVSNKSKSSSMSQSRKRSTDQRPSHRKEKRKKSESSQSDNKQILNKNIIINVNDCASKASEKCEPAKSVFNLFFSKEDKHDLKDAKKPDTSDKLYSDKYVKRKDTPKKLKEKEIEAKKSTSNTSNHSILSPNDVSSTSADSNTTKSDSKIKLKPIDMFVDKPKKPAVHQSHRNTVSAPVTTPTKISPNSQVNPKPSKQPKSHVSTQIIKAINSKESSVTKFSQTEKIKHASRFTQTDPISIKPEFKATDPFERMKEIDLEIQVLLQEKFKLYSSIESKESCSTSTGLGMTVLNVSSFTNTEADEDKSTDAIVEDFTNIPAEELEQIAIESAQAEKEMHNTKNRRRKQQRLAPKKKPKSRTSLISGPQPFEEVYKDMNITDYALLKNIKKTKKKPKKEPVKKNNQIQIVKTHVLKDCSVILERIDISKYLKPREVTNNYIEEDVAEVIVESDDGLLKVDNQAINVDSNIVNDMQFDMLDVSEDIVIGDMCEIKTVEEKDSSDRIVVSEEIILDNSQSSCDEAVPDTEAINNECKMYDYSADENLRRDATTVVGNADAVLAVECIENNFIAACLDGNVYHFSNEGQLINTLRGSNLAVTCLTIVKEKYGTTVYTGSLDSRIRYYDLETGVEKGPECNVLSPIQTMDKAWDTVFVGTRTGFVLQFECKNNMLIPVSTVKFSEQSILALRAMKEGPRKVLLVAARAENVTIKDAQSGLLLRTLEGPKMTVYTLLYEDGKVYCGTSSNLIHAFDYASGSHVGSHEGGKGAVCLRASGGLLFAGCYDGCVYVYREGDTRPLAQLRGPSVMLLSLAILGSKIIAGYKDRSLYIWKIPNVILQEMIL